MNIFLFFFVLLVCASPAAPQVHRHLRPYCDYVTALSPGQLHHLRDLTALVQLHARRAHELTLYVREKQRPSKSENLRVAFASAKPLEALQSELAAARGAWARDVATLNATIIDLRSRGLLPAGTSLLRVSECVMGRLNRQLFPGRPRASVLLNYFKRPWAIQPMVDMLSSCRGAGLDVELVVNVDNPQEAADWANASAATGETLLGAWNREAGSSWGGDSRGKRHKAGVIQARGRNE